MDKDADAIPVKLGAKSDKVVPFTSNLQALAITKGQFMVDLQVADSDLQQALDITRAAQAKLEKIAEEDLVREVSKEYDSAIERLENVSANIPESISKVQELKREVTANEVGVEIPDELVVKVKGETSNAVVVRKNAA